MKNQNTLQPSEQLHLIEKATDVAAEGIIITDVSQPHNPIIFVNDDIIELSEHTFGILIVDVTGHGIPAALLTFMSSIIFKNVSPGEFLSKKVLSQTNEILFGHKPGGTFVSMFYLIYDSQKKKLKFSQAGHPQEFFLRMHTKDRLAMRLCLSAASANLTK